jgi:hypothetical protein
MISNLIIPTLFLIDSLVCAGFAVFAYQLGIDPNPDWGTSRYALLLLGIILFSISIFLFSGKLDSFAKSEKAKTIFLIGHVWAVIFIIYAWFITFGNFTTWKNTTRYYSQLADAFNNGQLHIDAKIGDLAKADDPYNNESRPLFDDGDGVWPRRCGKLRLHVDRRAVFDAAVFVADAFDDAAEFFEERLALPFDDFNRGNDVNHDFPLKRKAIRKREALSGPAAGRVARKRGALNASRR